MAPGSEPNYHFKQVVAGAPQDVVALFGEALLALDAQRRGGQADAAGLLRRAWLALARHLVTSSVNELDPYQLLFLLSGAIGDTVQVKNANGERIAVELLPAGTCERLLAQAAAAPEHPSFILDPARLIAALAARRLEPGDSGRTRRWKEPVESAEAESSGFAGLARSREEARTALNAAREELQAALRAFTDELKAERLSPVLKAATALNAQAAELLALANDPAGLEAARFSSDDAGSPALKSALVLKHDLEGAVEELLEALQHTLAGARHFRAQALALHKAGTGGREPAADLALSVPPETALVIEKEVEGINRATVQVMQNSPARTPWSSSRVLLAEHTEKFADPARQCYATPENLAASFRKIDALHPNCFSRDAAGRPVVPPIIIVPGTGFVRFLDDRFLLSFVCTEPARTGKELSLSPVDLAVMQVYGLFLARGDIFNYRGERIGGTFMGEYAGEIESKAAVKFTGAEKKMTIVSAATERDASSREDAVRDYIDFFFHIMNGLPVPKRISPRKVGVFLKYCIVGSPARTALLVLRHIFPHDFQAAREVLLKLAGRDPAALVGMLEQALQADPQLASRFRRELRTAVEEVMGRDFLGDVLAAGLLAPSSSPASAPPGDAEGGAKQPSAGHDYFEL